MSRMEPIYGFLGVGSIATAIVTGLSEGVAEPPPVVLSPRNAERAADLAERLPSVRVATSNQAVVDASNVVVVCLLPTDTADVLAGLDFRADQAVVSAVAALPVAQLAELVAPAYDVARSIPLPAVATRGSITPVHPETPAVTGLFGRLGGSLVVGDEPAYESVAAASATVAAHFRYLGTIAEWLAARGIPGAEARRYVAATFAALSDELGAPEPDFEALARATLTRREHRRPHRRDHHSHWAHLLLPRATPARAPPRDVQTRPRRGLVPDRLKPVKSLAGIQGPACAVGRSSRVRSQTPESVTRSIIT